MNDPPAPGVGAALPRLADDEARLVARAHAHAAPAVPAAALQVGR